MRYKLKKLSVLCSLMLIALLVGSILVGCGPSTGTAEWHAQEAYEMADQGRYDEAIEECNKSIELDPA